MIVLLGDGRAQTIHRIWVDPGNGTDATTEPVEFHINNVDAPCRTLQFAIDTMHGYLVKSYVPGVKDQGVVYCLPGLFGAHGPNSSGDTYPIVMRDRVNVQGLGADRCILRGNGVANHSVFWPREPSTFCQPAGTEVVETLVHFRLSSQYSGFPDNSPPSTQPPWKGDGETAEFLDGLTLQGGDVQVLVGSFVFFGPEPWVTNTPIDARVSNCIFDMRHNWTPQVQGYSAPALTGPTFGLMNVATYFNPGFVSPCTAGQGPGGYYDNRVFAFNNTFVMGEWGQTLGWHNLARSNCVAIIDATNPVCSGTPCTFADPNQAVRGLGSTCLLNNVIRTVPDLAPSNQRFAMLGIEASDQQVSDGFVSKTTTNAFSAARAGSTNGPFQSLVTLAKVQVNVGPYGPLYDCVPASCGVGTNPTPAVRLWNGQNPVPGGLTEYDPGFVGEYVRTLAGFSTTYRDWRILPGSPLIDQGFSASTLIFGNGATWIEPTTPELKAFVWDSENYGNPRVVGDGIDIGADEFHLAIMCGSYANDSRCHNDNALPVSYLNPSAVSSGSAQRLVIVDGLAWGQQTMNIQRTSKRPDADPIKLPGWIAPPVTLTTPIVDPNITDPDFNTKYITFSATAWKPNLALSLGIQYQPGFLASVLPAPSPMSVLHWDALIAPAPPGFPDIECSANACTHWYWNTQVEIVYGGAPGERAYSNLQVEYR